MTKIFPALLIILDISAAIVYMIAGDVRNCVYWLAAATLTVVVTF